MTDTPSSLRHIFSSTRPSFVLAKVTVALQTSPLSCRKARKARIFTLVRESYGATSWFGWKLDETIGAKILSVPVAVPLKVARDTYLILIAVAIILLILNLLLHYLVITPMKRDWQWDAVSTPVWESSGESRFNTLRPHEPLGYKPPAPEVFVPAFAAWPAALRRPAPPATLPLAQRPTLN